MALRHLRFSIYVVYYDLDVGPATASRVAGALATLRFASGAS